MTTPTVNFRKRDLVAALDCAKKVGISIRRIEIEGGKLTIVTGEPEAPPKPEEKPHEFRI